jgi:hypothetical protein
MRLATFVAASLAVIVTLSLAAQSELVIVREGQQFYHRPGCSVVRDGKDVLAMSRAQAEARGYKSHPACDPAVAPPDSAQRDGKPAAPQPPVYTDASGKYYHRADCRKLAKPPRKLTLDEAATSKLWPCPVCRPPIRKRANEPINSRYRG